MLSIGAALLAHAADNTKITEYVWKIDPSTNEKLLSIMAASMLVIATFAMASMITAYGAASSAATPRSLPLVLADDVSQTALSSFIGAFIFSIVALIAVLNGYYGPAGQFVLFSLIVIVFAWVVFIFVRWVDNVARLGRLGNTIDKVEAATKSALVKNGKRKYRYATGLQRNFPIVTPVPCERIGYVQQINFSEIQEFAEKNDCYIHIEGVPGTFVTPDKPLVYVGHDEDKSELQTDKVAAAFRIGHDRLYDEDPRFGLVVLAEIAGRALSPAVNDPGTAIDVIGTLVRLFIQWSGTPDVQADTLEFDRVSIPILSVADMFEDAFTSISRDGAGTVEVAVRLQKGLAAMAAIGEEAMATEASRQSRLALKRCEKAMQLSEDLERVRAAASRVGDTRS